MRLVSSSQRKCMEVGERWSLAWPRRAPRLALLLGLVAGCATMPTPLDEALLADKKAAAIRQGGVVESYVVGCPDILEIRIKSAPERANRLPVEPFDRIYIGENHQSSLAKCFPKWLRPAYETLFGLSRQGIRNQESGARNQRAEATIGTGENRGNGGSKNIAFSVPSVASCS